MERKPSGIAVGVAAVGLAAALAGCSGGGREYALPGKVCDVPVKKGTLSPLLPDGEKLREVPGGLPGSRSGCALVVDRARILTVSVSSVDKLYDPMAGLESYKFSHRKRIPKLPFAGKGAVGDTNAMISTECGSPEAEFLIVDFIIRNEHVSVKQRRKDLQHFAEAYVPDVRRTLKCRT